MILAAGRGTRLAQWTVHTPKPLVPVRGVPVIERTLWRLAALGFSHVVINVHHLGDKLRAALGDGSRFGLELHWSVETELLETGGGVRQALPLLGREPVFIINGDILWAVDVTPLLAGFQRESMDMLLALVPPPQGQGDFLCDAAGRLTRAPSAPGAWTYAGLQVLDPRCLEPCPLAPFSLNRVFDQSARQGRLFGHPLSGPWMDMGSPEQLATAERTWVW
ncbi:MAG: nucleotidyltransferase family protein [Magnetococcus sp. WYHC-3]